MSQVRYPGQGTYAVPGSLVSASPVSKSDLAAVGALYGPDGRVISDLKTQESYGFGPWTPFVPVLPDGTPARALEYVNSFNTILSPRQEDGKSLSFASLRALAQLCPYYRVMVEKRKKKFRGLTLSWIPRDSNGKSVKKTPAYLAAVTSARAFWSQPNRIDQLRFSGFLNQILEEVFVTDAVAFFVWRTYGEELYALRQIDGSTIKLNIDVLGTVVGYQQILYGRAVTNHSPEMVELDSSQILYYTYNPVVSALYGTSPLEEIAPIVSLAIRRLADQVSWFTEGNIRTAIIEMPEGISTPSQLAEVQAYFDLTFSGDESVRHKMLCVPKGSGYREAKPFQFSKEAEEAMLTIMANHLGIARADFIAQVNRATAESNAQEATDSGQKPLEVWMKEWVDEVTQDPDMLGLEEIECQWSGESTAGTLDSANADSILVTAGILTRDEVRSERGYDPLDEVTDDGSTIPADGTPAPVPDGDGAAGAGDGGGQGAGADAGKASLRVGPSDRSGDGGAGGVRKDASSASGGAGRDRGNGDTARAKALQELATWKRFALKPERVKRGRWADPFETQIIPDQVSRGIASRLTEAYTVTEVRDVFDSFERAAKDRKLDDAGYWRTLEADVTRSSKSDPPARQRAVEAEFAPLVAKRHESLSSATARLLAGAKTAEEVRHRLAANQHLFAQDEGLIAILAAAQVKARADGMTETK